MIRKLAATSLLCLLAPSTAAIAQQTPATNPAAPSSPAAVAPQSAEPSTPTPDRSPVPTTSEAKPDANGMYKLRDGDDVQLTFAQDLSSKTASDGDPVMLILAEDLKVGGVVVARAGAKAVGEITNAKKSGMMGKAGELNLRLDYLKVGDTKVHLRGTKGKEGESGTTSAVVLTVLFGPIGLIKHGKNVDIKQGTPLKAFVSDDIALPPAQPAGS